MIETLGIILLATFMLSVTLMILCCAIYVVLIVYKEILELLEDIQHKKSNNS